MQRKIIQQSATSLGISLPSKWTKENNLKKGFNLNVNQEEDQLIISIKEKEKRIKEIEINIKEENERSIRSVLVNTYRTGYDKIIVQYKGDKDILTKITNRYLLGFEVFHTTKETYSIESVSEPVYDNFEKIIQKKLFIISEILQDIGNSEILFNVTNVQKYDNFLKRCISKNIIRGKSQIFIWQFLSGLTHIARESYHLNKTLKKPFKFNKNEILILDKIKEMFSILQKGYLIKDIDTLTKLNKIEESIATKKKIIFKQSTNPIIAHYLIYIARSIYMTSSPLIGALQIEEIKKGN